MIQDIFIILFFTCFAFLIRYLIIMKSFTNNTKVKLADEAYHYCVIRQLKKSFKYIGCSHILTYSEPDRLPILFHKLCAKLFHMKLLRQRSYIPNLFIFTIIFALYASYIFYLSYFFISINPIFVLTIYLTFSLNFYFGKDRILYLNLSDRLSGSLFCSLYVLSMVFYVQYGDIISFLIAIFTCTTSLMISYFTRQSVVLFTVLFSCILLSIKLILPFCISIFLCFLIEGKYFYQSLRHQYFFSKFYKKYYLTSPYVSAAIHRFFDIKKILKNWGLKTFVSEVFSNEPVRSFKIVPEYFIYYAIFFMSTIASITETYGPYFSVAYILPLLIYALISFPALAQFGESFRYFDYSLQYLLPLILYNMFVNFNYISFLFFVLFFIYRIFSLPKKLDESHEDGLFYILKNSKIKKNDVVFTVPWSLGSAVASFTNCKCFSIVGSLRSKSMMDKFSEEVPFLKKNWDPLFKEFNVKYVLVDKKVEAQRKSKMSWDYNYGSLSVLIENNGYILYEV